MAGFVNIQSARNELGGRSGPLTISSARLPRSRSADSLRPLSFDAITSGSREVGRSGLSYSSDSNEPCNYSNSSPFQLANKYVKKAPPNDNREIIHCELTINENDTEPVRLSLFSQRLDHSRSRNDEIRNRILRRRAFHKSVDPEKVHVVLAPDNTANSMVQLRLYAQRLDHRRHESANVELLVKPPDLFEADSSERAHPKVFVAEINNSHDEMSGTTCLLPKIDVLHNDCSHRRTKVESVNESYSKPVCLAKSESKDVPAQLDDGCRPAYGQLVLPKNASKYASKQVQALIVLFSTVGIGSLCAAAILLTEKADQMSLESVRRSAQLKRLCTINDDYIFGKNNGGLLIPEAPPLS